MDINIDENISNVERAIAEHRAEIFRLEGSLRVFMNMKQAGVTVISVKQEDLLETKEVIENVQGGQQ